jgi:hypothetical protein
MFKNLFVPDWRRLLRQKPLDFSGSRVIHTFMKIALNDTTRYLARVAQKRAGLHYLPATCRT